MTTGGVILHFRAEWSNGTCIFVVTFPRITWEQRREIESAADAAGFLRSEEVWMPPGSGGAILGFTNVLSGIGFRLQIDDSNKDWPANLQRLRLEPETRCQLEALPEFKLTELSGYCPVQGQGQLDGQYWYFRARGSSWRFELGGNDSGSKVPVWWHEEYWPNDTGFEAGYLTDEEAISCILKAVELSRTSDRSRFERGHADYERTMLEGWSIRALSLRRVIKRLCISGEEAIARMKAYGIELPYTADLELKSLNSPRSTVHAFNRATGKWIVIDEENE
ncbi:hypothetical protein [Rhizobium sp. RAF56]|uniref:hypothetical protein n=1 Tax=Rhizobium sp. RAF56 TaxID=3233062 RepID=UPI003F98A3D3